MGGSRKQFEPPRAAVPGRESRGRGRDPAENCALVRQNYGMAPHRGELTLAAFENGVMGDLVRRAVDDARGKACSAS